MAPPYETPALPIPSSYSGDAGVSPNDGTSAAAVGWRDYFTDPQLQHLLQQALANNRDLRIAVLRVEEARAMYGIQRS